MFRLLNRFPTAQRSGWHSSRLSPFASQDGRSLMPGESLGAKRSIRAPIGVQVTRRYALQAHPGRVLRKHHVQRQRHDRGDAHASRRCTRSGALRDHRFFTARACCCSDREGIGRDPGNVHHALSEIPHERRVGYDRLGDWPRALLEEDYPAWREKQSIESFPYGITVQHGFDDASRASHTLHNRKTADRSYLHPRPS